MNETESFGPFVIKNIKEDPHPGYILREFLVSKGHQSPERKIYHFHFQVSQVLFTVQLIIDLTDFLKVP